MDFSELPSNICVCPAVDITRQSAHVQAHVKFSKCAKIPQHHAHQEGVNARAFDTKCDEIVRGGGNLLAFTECPYGAECIYCFTYVIFIVILFVMCACLSSP